MDETTKVAIERATSILRDALRSLPPNAPIATAVFEALDVLEKDLFRVSYRRPEVPPEVLGKAELQRLSLDPKKLAETARTLSGILNPPPDTPYQRPAAENKAPEPVNSPRSGFPYNRELAGVCLGSQPSYPENKAPERLSHGVYVSDAGAEGHAAGRAAVEQQRADVSAETDAMKIAFGAAYQPKTPLYVEDLLSLVNGSHLEVFIVHPAYKEGDRPTTTGPLLLLKPFRERLQELIDRRRREIERSVEACRQWSEQQAAQGVAK